MRAQLAPLLLTAHRLTRSIRPAPKNSFRILLFHDVSAAEQTAFYRLVGDLARRSLLLTPQIAEQALAGEAQAPAGSCLLTFDDGFKGNRETADRLTTEFGAAAVFFICPGLMDLPADRRDRAVAANIFDGKRPVEPRELMDWDDLEHLRAAGHVIGNHTMDHLRLSLLPPDRQAEQIGEAARIIAARLGPTDWFAYTFGDVDSIDASGLREAGARHKYCRSGIRGADHAGVHPLALRADHVDLTAVPAWRSLCVEGGLDAMYRKQRAALDAMADAACRNPAQTIG